MACIQPLGLPLRDIVGTGFDHEGTERHRVAKQGWKQGDQSKGDYNVENKFEKDVNPVVIDYDADDEKKMMIFGVRLLHVISFHLKNSHGPKP